MSYSYTTTESFTKTHARRLAAKVAADMHQCSRLYERPTEQDIEGYMDELAVMLAGGYVQSYEFGFKTSDDKRILSWLYEVGPAGDLEGGRSGSLYPNGSVQSASSFNFLTYSSAWYALESATRDQIEASHPVNRTTGSPPQDGNGFWDTSRTYASGGVAITRKEFRPYGN